MSRPPPHRRPRSRRPGATFVEIMIAMAILAAALVPISGLLVGTADQTAATKAESSAASYAAKLMNYFLDELPFDDPLLIGADEGATSKTIESEDVDASEHPGIGGPDLVIDGTRIRWTLEVEVIPNDAITPDHRLIRYHSPTAAPCDPAESYIPAEQNPSDPDSYSSPVEDATLVELDRKNDQPVLKELRLTIQWRTPRNDAFEDIDTPPHKRTVSLITRRARL